MLVALTAMTYIIPIAKISILIAMFHPIRLSRSMLAAMIRNMTQEMNRIVKKVVMRKTKGPIFVIYLQCGRLHGGFVRMPLMLF